MANFSHSTVSISFLDLLCILLLLFCSLNSSFVYGARQEPEYYLQPEEMKSLAPPSDFLTSTKGHNHQQKVQSMRNSQRTLLQDYNIIPDEYGEGIVLPLRSARDDGDYLVTVGFGTPKRDFTLFFDTGSDVTWIQCQSCTPHCNTQFPIFDPSSSSTFSNITNCTSCDYNMTYNDGSYSYGYYVKDTLTITSDPISNFVFGCAQNIDGNFGGADGLLGVGQGSKSLLAQTDPNFFSLFCYCLPAATDTSSGYLVFGVQAFETCQPETNAMVPIIPVPGKSGLTSYFVTLIGITIGQQRLDISSYQSSPLKAVLDSGTPITRLPPLVYSALRSVFQVMMLQYPAANSSDPLFDTCYNLQGHGHWSPPNLVLHFDNSVNVNLDQSAAVLQDDSQVCLAFAGNDAASDLTIIGNRQHRAINLFFDIKNAKLAFGSGGCTNLLP